VLDGADFIACRIIFCEEMELNFMRPDVALIAIGIRDEIYVSKEFIDGGFKKLTQQIVCYFDLV
jgi:hypothetical protein